MVACADDPQASASPNEDASTTAPRSSEVVEETTSHLGLSAPVSVAWDTLGVPHIRAASLEDLYCALGYVTAHDRLWQMDLLRRRVLGDASELLGNGALRSDGAVRILGTRAWVEHAALALDHAPSSSVRAIDAFVRGVNAYLTQMARTKRRPAEYRTLHAEPSPWKRSDTIAIILGQGLTLDFDTAEIEWAASRDAIGVPRRAEMDRYEPLVRYNTVEGDDRVSDTRSSRATSSPGDSGALPSHTSQTSDQRVARTSHVRGTQISGTSNRGDTPDDLTPGTSPPRDEERQASNAWAVAGRLSASGKPLLANDPHLDLTTPPIWYAVHLVVPDTLDAAGVMVPGVPLIISGRNRHAAWGITALEADVVDYTCEMLSPDGRQYLVGSRWESLGTMPLGLRYKAGPLHIPVPGVHRRVTRHGPLLLTDRDGRRGYAVRWAPLELPTLDLTAFGLERARSVNELRARVRHIQSPTLNVIMADDDGHIAYQAVGLLPRRVAPATAGPKPGWLTGAEWKGWLPVDSLPAATDPARGFLVTANNRPSRRGAYVAGYDLSEYRARRIAELLASHRGPMTLDDMARVQLDVQTPDAREFLDAMLARVCGASHVREGAYADRYARALDVLARWDRRANVESAGQTIFRAWFNQLRHDCPAARRSGLLARMLRDATQYDWWDDPATPERESAEVALARAFTRACDALDVLLGPDPERWTYGAAHRAHFAHALEQTRAGFRGPSVGVAGDPSSVRHGSSALPGNPDFGHSASWRMLVDLGDPEAMRVILPPGNAGDASSPYARNMLERWVRGEYATLRLAMPEAAARAAALTLAPERAARAER
jgi:penicillin amidase